MRKSGASEIRDSLEATEQVRFERSQAEQPHLSQMRTGMASLPTGAPPAPEGGGTVPVGTDDGSPLPRGGLLCLVFGVGLILLATMMVVIGIIEGDPDPIGVGSLIGMFGTGGFCWGLRALNEHRKAFSQLLQRKVLLLARNSGGTVTVTDVASDLNLTLPAAENLLISMDDGFRVRFEISKEGVLYYQFPEVVQWKVLEPRSEV